jgi:hypothetical protein
LPSGFSKKMSPACFYVWITHLHQAARMPHKAAIAGVLILG